MADIFTSPRLLYRAVDPSTDESLFRALHSDPLSYTNTSASLLTPPSPANSLDYLKYVAEKCLLGIVICLAPPTTATATPAPVPPTPIGVIVLNKDKPEQAHYRHTEIGIDILRQYQGQGYGSEAIQWALRWAFRMAGMHRVQIRCFGYNEGAKRLYERLGFTPEGRWREFLWYDGRWWDDLQFAMLEREWREMQEKKA